MQLQALQNYITSLLVERDQSLQPTTLASSMPIPGATFPLSSGPGDNESPREVPEAYLQKLKPQVMIDDSSSMLVEGVTVPASQSPGAEETSPDQTNYFSHSAIDMSGNSDAYGNFSSRNPVDSHDNYHQPSRAMKTARSSDRVTKHRHHQRR